MSFSYWEKSTFIKSPDVIIIGSGIVGLNAALSLKTKSPKLKVIVLERGMLPYGASTRNAGFACYGSSSELLEDLRRSSKEEVFSLVEKRWKGLKRLRNILGDDGIDYEPLGGYEVFSKADETLFSECVSFLPELNNYLQEISGQDDMYVVADDKIKSFGFDNVNHMILNRGEGQIDTGKMMKTLLDAATAAGVEIYNGANVESIADNSNDVTLTISDYKETPIKTSRLLICTNGFAKKFLTEYDIMPARAQVLITKPIPGLAVKGSFHYDHGYFYFRNVGNRLMLGGGRNLDFDSEQTEEFGITQNVQARLIEMLNGMILPETNYEIDMRWSGIMGLGNSKTPVIKKTGHNIYCAVRMGGMGIAIGSLVGEEAASMILESL